MKNRLFFLLWTVMLAVLWLIGELTFAGILLTDSILAALVLAMQAGIAARHLKTDSTLKGSRNGENRACLKIRTDYKGLIPVKLCLQMEVQNQLTGETGRLRGQGVLAGRGGDSNDLQLWINESHAGKLQIKPESMRITDLLGLVSFRIGDKKESREKRLSCLLLPETVKVPLLPEIAEQYDQNSDAYAEDRPGPDLSQTHELREYRSGDSLRSIHWKRSSRGDSWIVREGSLPVGKDLLLLLENSYSPETGKSQTLKTGRETKKGTPQDAIEKACARLIALSENLTDRGISHCIGCWSRETQSLQIVEIHTAEDLIQELGRLLSTTLEDGKTIEERFLQSYGEETFSQVIIIDDETTKIYNF